MYIAVLFASRIFALKVGGFHDANTRYITNPVIITSRDLMNYIIFWTIHLLDHYISSLFLLSLIWCCVVICPSEVEIVSCRGHVWTVDIMKAHARACNSGIRVPYQTVTGSRVIFLRCSSVELQSGVSGQDIRASFQRKGRAHIMRLRKDDAVAGKRMSSSLESSVEGRTPRP